MSGPSRREAIEEYKAEKRGFYGLVDPGPRIEPLEEIGIKIPKRLEQYGPS